MATSMDQVRKLEDILKALRGKEIGSLDAFLQIKHLIQPEDSIQRLRKHFQFWSFELKASQLELLSPKERLLFLRRYLFEEKGRILKKSIAPPNSYGSGHAKLC